MTCRGKKTLWARRLSPNNGDGWHPGVVGIVANRLCSDMASQPVDAIADGMGRGSLRTVPG